MFAEKLPEQCPPHYAEDQELNGFYRLLDSKDCTEECFSSHAALGKAKPKTVTDCAWASCSLTSDPRTLSKFPQFKDTHKWAAKVYIPKGAGRSTIRKSHADFWRYVGFEFTPLVLGIEVLDD